MTIPKLKDLVQDNLYVSFAYYQTGCLWYEHETTKFLFPVPISDTGDGKFLNRDKAMFFMRWMRQYIKALNDTLDKLNQVVV